MEEVYKDVPGYYAIYQVSNLGNVKTFRTGKVGKIMKQTISTHYKKVGFSRGGKNKTWYVHQLVAMAFLNHTPSGYNVVVDHINSNPLDNRLENLRLVTHRENISLQERTTSSKYTGVYWHKIARKWCSMIVINGNKKYLGLFTDELEASQAYQSVLLKLNQI